MYVLVLVGIPGAGKSTLCKRLASSGWRHINQDELGSRRSCEESMRMALRAGQHIVIDRCNHTEAQRSHWIKLSKECGIGGISLVALQLLLPLEICKARARNRVDHPTLGMHNCDEVIDRFYSEFTEATTTEGFDRIVTAYMSEEADAAVEQLIAEAGTSIVGSMQSFTVWTQPLQHTSLGAHQQRQAHLVNENMSFCGNLGPGYQQQQQEWAGVYGHWGEIFLNGSYGSYYNGYNINSYAHLATQAHQGHARPGSYGYYSGANVIRHFSAEWEAEPHLAHVTTTARGMRAGTAGGGICGAEGSDKIQVMTPEPTGRGSYGAGAVVGVDTSSHAKGPNGPACSSGRGLRNYQTNGAKESNCEDASGSESVPPMNSALIQSEEPNAQVTGEHTSELEFHRSYDNGHLNGDGAGGHVRGRGRGTYQGGRGGGGNWRRDGGEQNSHFKVVKRLRYMFADPSSTIPYDTPAEPGTESDPRIILLFDLNGTLTCHTSVRKAKGITKLRPGTEHLLQLHERFRLGIYTSSTVRTVQSAIEMLEEAAGGALFDRRLVLHRDHTAPAPAGHVDAGGNAWDTSKPLGRYFSRLDRVVLVDDDSYKSIAGEEANMLIVPCWQEDDMDCPVLRVLCELLVAQVTSEKQSEDADVRRWTAIVSEELQKVATKAVEPSSLLPAPDDAKAGIKEAHEDSETIGEDRVRGKQLGKRQRELPTTMSSDPAEICLN
ncbi:hypothetical protein VaNZ11_001616 [Volvox africanus]|uniref:FCP1 homology domain-containing protein n=1 Tax=Volvox africanus TaxID=51714 RepID=A0ABQ5RRE7_9CHLO|nr:hypothetical protein VaNZ11_001616 [Volvox africanus]